MNTDPTPSPSRPLTPEIAAEVLERLHERLRASGRTVRVNAPSDDGEMTVTFPANRSADAGAE